MSQEEINEMLEEVKANKDYYLNIFAVINTIVNESAKDPDMQEILNGYVGCVMNLVNHLELQPEVHQYKEKQEDKFIKKIVRAIKS